jgi:metal-responsive CopG/Arc/MetJ family transcriptional regulator
MTSLTVHLDDLTAQALDRLVPPGGSREETVVVALHEYLFRQERARRREQAAGDAEILARYEEDERERAEWLIADQDM